MHREAGWLVKISGCLYIATLIASWHFKLTSIADDLTMKHYMQFLNRNILRLSVLAINGDYCFHRGKCWYRI